MIAADLEAVRAARAKIRTRFGKDFENKGSDAFCLAAFGSIDSGGLEDDCQSPELMIEFDHSLTTPANPSRHVTSRQSQQLDTVARLIAGTTGVGAAAHSPKLFRQAMIMAMRDEFLNAVQPVLSEVERKSGGPKKSAPEWASGNSDIDIYYLSGTIGTHVPIALLADVATDSSVARVDVPQRLYLGASASSRTHEAHFRNLIALGLPESILDREHTGKGVTVAVIDTEVALDHTGLTGRITHKTRGTYEGWGVPGNHATTVAGIIADNHGPNQCGVAPDAVIYNYKIFPSRKNDQHDRVQEGPAISALQQALEDGADIANCSWGYGRAGDPTLSSGHLRMAFAVERAWAAGLTVVKSAGNRGPQPGSVTRPADVGGIIVVGATDVAGTRVAIYSGRPVPGGRGLDVVAPGGDSRLGISGCQANGGRRSVHGTSFAAPHVSGLLATYLEADPNQGPDQLRATLVSRATPLTGWSQDDQGYGLARAS